MEEMRTQTEIEEMIERLVELRHRAKDNEDFRWALGAEQALSWALDLTDDLDAIVADFEESSSEAE